MQDTCFGSTMPSSSRPPPSEDDEARATKKVRRREDLIRLGYREAVAAGASVEATMEDSVGALKVAVEAGDIQVDRSGKFPVVALSVGLKERLCRPSRYAVIVNLLGRSIGYKSLCTKLEGIWNMTNAKVLDIGNGYFMVDFEAESAYLIALLEGPWTILGSYLQVQAWHSKFRVHQCTPRTAVVWARVPELPLQYYPEDVMGPIGEAIGKVIRIDYNTV